jgi:hypothetical protein
MKIPARSSLNSLFFQHRHTEIFRFKSQRSTKSEGAMLKHRDFRTDTCDGTKYTE